MAAIIFGSASRAMRVREQYSAALSVCRQWLDAFVSNRMRHAVAKVENVRRGDASIELVHNDTRICDMAMLTHGFERPVRSTGTQRLAQADSANAHLAMIKRVCLIASTLLLAGGALAAIIALKTAIYFARFHL
jgi:hypothetical protein